VRNPRIPHFPPPPAPHAPLAQSPLSFSCVMHWFSIISLLMFPFSQQRQFVGNDCRIDWCCLCPCT
jgi:hypothetical protein